MSRQFFNRGIVAAFYNLYAVLLSHENVGRLWMVNEVVDDRYFCCWCLKIEDTYYTTTRPLHQVEANHLSSEWIRMKLEFSFTRWFHSELWLGGIRIFDEELKLFSEEHILQFGRRFDSFVVVPWEHRTLVNDEQSRQRTRMLSHLYVFQYVIVIVRTVKSQIIAHTRIRAHPWIRAQSRFSLRN